MKSLVFTLLAGLIGALAHSMSAQVVIALPMAESVEPPSRKDKPTEGFLTRAIVPRPSESEVMARRFGRVQAVPLAEQEIPPDEVCIRLHHAHGRELRPPVASISVEVRVSKGGAGEVFVMDTLAAKSFQTKVGAKESEELIKLFDEARFFLPSPKHLPRYIAGFKFDVEVRCGAEYRYIRVDAPSEDTVGRGLDGLLKVIHEVIRLAGIPESKVFYGRPM